jgi:hypothetical protein
VLLAAFLLSVTLVSVTAQRSDVDLAPSYQLLTNSGVEVYDPPYAQFEGVDCQAASGWERFWYDGPEPYWMDTRVFADSHLGSGWVERIEGETSQLIIATEPYTAGIRQQVAGLTPGVGYGFHAAMLTIFQTSAPPAEHGTMIKQVGIDPTGGTDPEADSVIWSEPDDHDEGPWDVDQRTAVHAQAPVMTVFVRVISPYEAGGLPYLNYSFLDSAILARTPVITATSPAVTDVPTFTVRWDNVVAAPGAKKLKGRDVQWMDEADGVWHDWITDTYDGQATFVGQRNHTYRFRARAWQKYLNGALLAGPYRPEGDTATTVRGPKLVGQVLNSRGHPVAGATVAISGTTYATTSGYGGRFELDALPWLEPQSATVSHPWWASPAPVHGLTFGLTETVPLTWTLGPPGDAVVNGQFEAGLAGWSPITSQGVAPMVVSEPVHTGRGSLALRGSTPITADGVPQQDLVVGVTQTVVLTDVWEPIMSFWVLPATASPSALLRTNPSATFNVVLTTVSQTTSPTLPVTTTRVFTPDLDVDDWQHLWYLPHEAAAAFTGTVEIAFQVKGAVASGDPAAGVYLDEVSLGGTPGGPLRVYMPLVRKQY